MTEIGIAVSVAAFSMHDGIAVRGTLFFLRVSIFESVKGQMRYSQDLNVGTPTFQ